MKTSSRTQAALVLSTTNSTAASMMLADNQCSETFALIIPGTESGEGGLEGGGRLRAASCKGYT